MLCKNFIFAIHSYSKYALEILNFVNTNIDFSNSHILIMWILYKIISKKARFMGIFSYVFLGISNKKKNPTKFQFFIDKNYILMDNIKCIERYQGGTKNVRI